MSVVTSTRSPVARAEPDLVQEIVHLTAHRPHVHLGIHQPGGPNDLLDDDAARQAELVVARRGRQGDHLGHQRHELVELERPVVQRGGQAETVVHQSQLARAVAVEHSADLRQAYVRLVHHHQKIRREVVDETRRPLPGAAPAQVARVVLDAGAGPHLEQHLDVELGARLQPLGLEQLARALELGQTLGQLGPDQGDGALDLGPLGDEVLGGIDGSTGRSARWCRR